ncbi:MAG: hypothetical protein R3E39_19850 [Anaerolineae bacterium]
MIDAMVDTNIIVDFLRNYHPAAQWVHSQNIRLGITSVTWMEVIFGAPDKVKRDLAFKTMKQFELIMLTDGDQEWA